MKQGDSANLFGGIGNRDIWNVLCEVGGADFRINCSTSIPKLQQTTTEFCNPCGGRGRSQQTWQALARLMLEIRKDTKAQSPQGGYPVPSGLQLEDKNAQPVRRISDEPPGYMEVTLLPQNSCKVACQARRFGKIEICTLQFYQLPSGIWSAMESLVAGIKQDNLFWPL